jgi:hypothetical protein
MTSSVDGYSNFKYTELRELRDAGWDISKVGRSSIAPQTFTGTAMKKEPCDVVLEDIFRADGDLKPLKDYNEYDVINTAVSLLAKHMMDMQDFAYFITDIIFAFFKKDPKKAETAIVGTFPVFAKIVEENDNNLILWDGLGMILYNIIGNLLPVERVFKILHNEIIPLRIQYSIKLKIRPLNDVEDIEFDIICEKHPMEDPNHLKLVNTMQVYVQLFTEDNLFEGDDMKAQLKQCARNANDLKEAVKFIKNFVFFCLRSQRYKEFTKEIPNEIAAVKSAFQNKSTELKFEDVVIESINLARGSKLTKDGFKTFFFDDFLGHNN